MAFLGLEVGSWAEWVGAIFSGVALVLVTNETRKNIKHDKEIFIINKDLDNLMLIETSIRTLKENFRELPEIFSVDGDSREFRERSFEIRELVSDILSVIDFISSEELERSVTESKYHLNSIDIELQKMSSNSLTNEKITMSISIISNEIIEVKKQIGSMKKIIKNKKLN